MAAAGAGQPLDGAAWAAVVAGVLSGYHKASMTASKVRKRAVKAAKARAPGASRAALREGFDRFLAANTSKVLRVEGSRVALAKQQTQQTQQQLQAAPDGPPPAKRQKPASATTAVAGQTAAEQSIVAAAKPSKKRKQRAEAAANGTPASAAAAPGGLEQSPAAKPSKKRKRKAEAGGEAAAGEGQAVMPPIGSLSWRESDARANVKHGRFSKQERATLREAAVRYAHERGLSDADFSWLYETRRGEQRKLTTGAWLAIAAALPHRTVNAVYRTGTRILHAHHSKGAWSAEDTDRLRQLVAQHGRRWVRIGKELQRLHWDCRDWYREVSSCDPAARQTGAWSEDESAALQQAVDEYMQERQEMQQEQKTAELAAEDLLLASPGGSSGGGARQQSHGTACVVLDDIDWGFVAARVRSRSRQQCMQRWYKCLAPSMVARGEWGSGDDRRLLKGLLRSGAHADFDVCWEDLVPGRSEKQARRRWRLMLKRVPDAIEKDFGEQLEYLVDTYCPGLKAKLGPNAPAD